MSTSRHLYMLSFFITTSRVVSCHFFPPNQTQSYVCTSTYKLHIILSLRMWYKNAVKYIKDTEHAVYTALWSFYYPQFENLSSCFFGRIRLFHWSKKETSMWRALIQGRWNESEWCRNERQGLWLFFFQKPSLFHPVLLSICHISKIHSHWSYLIF